jgi:5'-deoxynucleotidase YfbR-like HD superfamily hydrolase
MKFDRLDLFGLLVGAPIRLRYVRRFSTCRTGWPESVAEHSFYTSVYAMLLARMAEGPELSVNMADLLQKALLHDFEEAITGDINRPFKIAHDDLKHAIDKAAFLAFDRVWVGILPDWLARLLATHWTNAKDKSVEGRIVAFADFLSVLSYVVSEVRSSNLTMREHTKGMAEYLAMFQGPEYCFLQPEIEQARVILNSYVLTKQEDRLLFEDAVKHANKV